MSAIGQFRSVMPVGTQAAVEADSATLVEVLLAIDSTGELIGYSVDGGSTWVWTGSGLAASAVTVADAGGYFTGSDAEAVLQEIGAALASSSSSLAYAPLAVDDGSGGWHDVFTVDGKHIMVSVEAP